MVAVCAHDTSVVDVVVNTATSDPFELIETMIDLNTALCRLPVCDQLLILGKYSSELTDEQLGERFGMTKQGVNVKAQRIVARLRRDMMR